jgi:hypothetical protein
MLKRDKPPIALGIVKLKALENSPRNCNFESAPICVGICPLNLLLLSCNIINDVILPIDVGRVEFNWLFCASKIERFVSDPIPDGKLPARELEYNIKEVSDTRELMAVGIVPLNLF